MTVMRKQWAAALGVGRSSRYQRHCEDSTMSWNIQVGMQWYHYSFRTI